MASPNTIKLMEETAALRANSIKVITNHVGENREQYRRRCKQFAKMTKQGFHVTKNMLAKNVGTEKKIEAAAESIGRAVPVPASIA